MLSKFEGTGKLSFEAFYNIAANFLEDDDDEAMQNELKEAFRLYDKEGKILMRRLISRKIWFWLTFLGVFSGNGYITTAVLREILAALDDKLTPEDLDGIIEEIDEDGSGTIDFDGNRTKQTKYFWRISVKFLPLFVSEFMEMMTG